MTKRLLWLITWLAAISLLTTACSRGPAPVPQSIEAEPPVSQATPAEIQAPAAEAPAAEAPAPTEVSPAEVAPQTEIEPPAAAGEPPTEAAPDAAVAVPDTKPEAQAPIAAASVPGSYGLLAGSITDNGVNQLVWSGLQRAAQELGVQVQHTQVNPGDDYPAKINELLTQNVKGVISVGFDLAQAAKAASEANPQIAFINVDFPSQTANDLGLLFSTDQPSFMAGYLAAGMTRSGAVCTYGGQQTPPVLTFMVGFEHGVAYYNQDNGTNVQLLGWQTNAENPVGGSGVFVGTFTDQNTGREIAAQFFNQGCDIIFPVAGETGLGSLTAAKERGLKAIGVDLDQAQTSPEYADVILTSVLKKIDVAVFEAVKLSETGQFKPNENHGNNIIGTLANDGVGLAPFYNFEAQIPPPVKNKLAEIQAQLIDGTLSTGWPVSTQAVAIAPPPASDATPTAPTGGSLTMDALANGTYSSDWTATGTVTLVNGEYREQAAPGSASEIVVQMTQLVAFGDLTGNGSDEAAVILVTNGGGSGNFVDLAVMVNANGMPVNIATLPLGDRTRINSIVIENGEVVIDMVTHGPNDPMCCPTEPVVKYFGLKNVLVENIKSDEPLAPAVDAVGAYSATRPSASSPGIQLDLSLNPDGTVELISDYMNGQAPIVQSGTWTSNGPTVDISLTSLNGRPVDEQITFELQGDTLVATQYDQMVYGSEGLSLTRIY
jgi:basic membrane protein A